MRQSLNVTIGISQCLLGDAVRYDGADKANEFCISVLSQHANLISICPEVAIGLGIPRPPIQLVQRHEIALVDVAKGRTDHTAAMTDLAQHKAQELSTVLCGYIFKSKSPSCGLKDIPVFADNGTPLANDGQGLFAATIQSALPTLAVIDENDLADPLKRHHFLERAFLAARIHALKQQPLSVSTLQSFHAEHKYALMAHSYAEYRRIGKLLASITKANLDAADSYFENMQHAFALEPSIASHVNALTHIAGYLKTLASLEERHAITQGIAAFSAGDISFQAIRQRIQAQFRVTPHAYINQQTYLCPYPEALVLKPY